MTTDQINALAREYAREWADRVYVSYDNKDGIDVVSKIMARRIKWLAQHCYIVDKESVKEQYAKSLEAEKWGDRDDNNLYGGYVIETLFPEIKNNQQ